MSDADALAKEPVRLTLIADSKQPSQVSLVDWIHRRPEYRASVRDTGRRSGGRAGFSDAVVIAVVAQSLLPGLFALLQTWIGKQRPGTNVRVRIGDSEVELRVNNRTDPLQLLAEVTKTIQAAGGATPASAGEKGRTEER